MRSRTSLGTSIILGSLLVSAGASAAPARYAVVELGSFGGRGSYARAIDDQGRMVQPQGTPIPIPSGLNLKGP